MTLKKVFSVRSSRHGNEVLVGLPEPQSWVAWRSLSLSISCSELILFEGMQLNGRLIWLVVVAAKPGGYSSGRFGHGNLVFYASLTVKMGRERKLNQIVFFRRLPSSPWSTILLLYGDGDTHPPPRLSRHLASKKHRGPRLGIGLSKLGPVEICGSQRLVFLSVDVSR